MVGQVLQSNVRETFQTASDVAYQAISQKILDGEFPPGMKLSRRKMAEITGVSVIPVIEALKRLEEDHLVESKPQWGSFVIVPTLEKIKQNYELREAIECQSARILAKRMTPQQQSKLMEIAEQLDTIPYKADSIADSRMNHIQFHMMLNEFTGNHLLADTLRRINMFWTLCKAIEVNAPKVEYPRYWHRLLMDVIAKGDPDEAEQMMRRHINDSLVQFIAVGEL